MSPRSATNTALLETELDNSPRIIVSGGPGAGKTTLLCELERLGYNIVSESAREVIQRRKALGLKGRSVPGAFAKMILERDNEKYRQVSEDRALIFFDRCALEALLMLREAGSCSRAESKQLAAGYRFHRVVFMLPPWPEIYGQDAERDHSWEHAVRVYEKLSIWYRELGYVLYEVQFASAVTRAHRVLDTLKAIAH